MTVPMWTPFALLTAICVVLSPPAWTRRVDWVRVIGWWASLSFCLLVWYAVFRLIWRLA